MNNEEKPEDILFSKVMRISKIEMEKEPGWAERMSEKMLREHLSAFIGNAKIETKATPEYFEKRLEIYAASPAMFWSIVQKKAEEIAMRWGRTLDK